MQASQQHFQVAPSTQIQRSNFDRSSTRKTTLYADTLDVIYCDEVLPGDTFNMKAHIFGRVTSRLKTPLMDNLYLDTFAFFVPHRLVWDNSQKFFGEKIGPSAPDPSTFTIPKVFWDNFPVTVGSVPDQFGMPLGYGLNGDPYEINVLPLRARNQVINDWFIDQLRNDPLTVNMGNTEPVNWVATYPEFKRAKPNDYFTSTLLSPQRGLASAINAALTVTSNPLITMVPNVGNSPYTRFVNRADHSELAGGTMGTPNQPVETLWSGDGSSPGGSLKAFIEGATQAVGQVTLDPNGALQVDFASAGATVSFPVNDLRQAVAIQQLLELDNRGGTRYTEILRAHFEVISPDARLQRSEYLGGSTDVISINPIPASDAANLGATASFGTLSSSMSFVHSFVEHGYVLVFAQVRGDVTYQQGFERMFLRKTRYDFYWPTFAHLGEQPVYASEIFANDTETVPLRVFGYQERYAEYRSKLSQITGKLRSDAAGSLDAFHLAQDFAALPPNDDDFIASSTQAPLARALAVTTEPQFLLDCYFNLQCARPMPVYSIPGLTRL